MRRYREHPDFIEASQWKEPPVIWTGADAQDTRWPELNQPPQLYTLDCVAYESLLIGLFTIWHGERGVRPKLNDVAIGYSRDGFHWHRPDREAFIPTSDKDGDWNVGNVQSTGGCCLVVGDELYFYVSGRQGHPGTRESGACSTGLTKLRRDGFVSLDGGAEGGRVVTRPVKFTGKYLFVNADADGGELSAEVLDENGQVIEPFGRDNCIPVQKDETTQSLQWKGAKDLSMVAGRPVQIRFFLKYAKLYSFWVSPETNGASHGYVAAGGRGFTDITDTVGRTGRSE